MVLLRKKAEVSALVSSELSRAASSACPLAGEVPHMDFDNFLLVTGHFPL